LLESLGIAVSILAVGENSTGSYSVFSVRESPELTKYQQRWAWFLGKWKRAALRGVESNFVRA